MKRITFALIVLTGLFLSSVNVLCSIPVPILGSTSSSTLNQGTLPNYTYDGNTTTGWRPATTGTTEWIQFDLGAANTKIVDNIVINFSMSPYNYTVYGSKDGSSWTPLGTSFNNVLCGSTPSSFAVCNIKDIWRYIRIKDFTYTYSTSTCTNPINMLEVAISGHTNCIIGDLDCFQTLKTFEKLRVQSGFGYLDIIPNATYANFTTDRSLFYMNKGLMIQTGAISSYGSTSLFLQTGGTTQVTILNNGNVGIGCTNPTAKLSVNGKIESEEMEVKTICAANINVKMDNLADFVFKPGYKLNSLNEVESFIAENNHLPNMPSAQSVKENGMNVAEMNNLLLQKVEEMTLYMLDLNKQLQEAKGEIERLSSNK